MNDPTLFDIIFGKHVYSMSPELETEWCRTFILIGFFGGLFMGSMIK